MRACVLCVCVCVFVCLCACVCVSLCACVCVHTRVHTIARCGTGGGTGDAALGGRATLWKAAVDGMLSPESPWKLPWLKPVDLLPSISCLALSLVRRSLSTEKSGVSFESVAVHLRRTLWLWPLCALWTFDAMDLGKQRAVSGS